MPTPIRPTPAAGFPTFSKAPACEDVGEGSLSKIVPPLAHRHGCESNSRHDSVGRGHTYDEMISHMARDTWASHSSCRKSGSPADSSQGLAIAACRAVHHRAYQEEL